MAPLEHLSGRGRVTRPHSDYMLPQTAFMGEMGPSAVYIDVEGLTQETGRGCCSRNGPGSGGRDFP